MASYTSYEVPKNLLAALIQVESGGNPNAVSPKRARGLGQIMPETGKKPGFNIQPLQDNSPEENLRIARDYLGAMLQKYGGDKKLALAAYNAGPGAVDKAGGIPNYPETQAYVPKVLKAADETEREAFMAWKAKKADAKEREAFMAWKAKRQQPEQPQEQLQDQPQDPDQLEWADVPGEALRNLPSSAGSFIKGAAGAIAHPIDTAAGVAKLARGAMQEALPDSVTDYLVSKGITPEARPEFNAVVDAYKARYGSEEGFKRALASDPVNVAADISTVAGGLGLAASGAGLARTANVANRLSTITNPMSIPAKGAELVGKGAGLAGRYVSMPFTPTRNAANQLRKELQGFSEIPRTAPNTGNMFANVRGANPTAAMLTGDPAILKLEMNARVRNPLRFYERDIGNIERVYNTLREGALPDSVANAMQDIVNQNTGPLRQAAYVKAMENPVFRDVMQEYVIKKADEPGFRASSGMPLLDRTKRALILENKQERAPRIDLSTSLKDALVNKGDDLEQFKTVTISNAMPEDLYTLRKELKDKLELKSLSTDELTNAAKANRSTVMEITNKIDDALDKSSDGLWSKYLNKYREDMGPITQGRSFQNILDSFDTARTIPGTDIPQITPAALKKAVNRETYKNLGKENRSTIDDASRARLNDAVALMDALGNARAGTIASAGSPTAPYLVSLAKQGLTSATGSNMLIKGIEALNALGLTRGQNVLDDALLNPNRLQKILDAYHNQNRQQAKTPKGSGRINAKNVTKLLTPLSVTNRLSGEQNGR